MFPVYVTSATLKTSCCAEELKAAIAITLCSLMTINLSPELGGAWYIASIKFKDDSEV